MQERCISLSVLLAFESRSREFLCTGLGELAPSSPEIFYYFCRRFDALVVQRIEQEFPKF